MYFSASKRHRSDSHLASRRQRFRTQAPRLTGSSRARAPESGSVTNATCLVCSGNRISCLLRAGRSKITPWKTRSSFAWRCTALEQRPSWPKAHSRMLAFRRWCRRTRQEGCANTWHGRVQGSNCGCGKRICPRRASSLVPQLSGLTSNFLKKMCHQTRGDDLPERWRKTGYRELAD